MRMTGERGAGNDIKVIVLELKLSYEVFCCYMPHGLLV